MSKLKIFGGLFVDYEDEETSIMAFFYLNLT